MTELTSAQLTRRDELADELEERGELLKLAVAAYNQAVHERNGAVMDAAAKLNQTLDRIDAFVTEVANAIDDTDPEEVGADPQRFRDWLGEWSSLEFDPVEIPDAEEMGFPDHLDPDELRDLPERPAEE